MAARWTAAFVLARNTTSVLRYTLSARTALPALRQPAALLARSLPRFCAARHASTAAATKAKKNPAAKPAAKKPAAKPTKATTKTGPQAKTKAKAKATVKPKAKTPKSALTEEQEQKLKEKQLSQKAKDARKTALDAPKKPYGPTAYSMFIHKHNDQTGFTPFSSELGAMWKGLSEAEQAKYREAAQESHLAKQKAYVEWVEKYTPAEIVRANSARRWLKKYGLSPKTKHALIVDHRTTKQAMSAYNLWMAERIVAAGGGRADFATLGKEWKTASDAEKKKYYDLAQADKQRYESQKNILFA